MKKVLKELLLFNLLPFITGMFIVSDYAIRKSIFLGWSVVFISIGVGLLTFYFAKNKENKSFIKFYFSGMIARLFILLITIFFILKFIGINPISFLFSLFIFYIINQVIELRFIIRSLTKNV